ncbi:MAG: phenylalanine--tRNA ligase subunit alpha, partial [Clostridia bacterium]|nr:phenylalanine--tRNA ligase subunit alpha [Clostridia bacterium]
MREQLQKIKEEAVAAISSAQADIEALRVKYLGKKGELTSVLRQMGSLSAEERPAIGQLANEIRGQIELLIEKKAAEMRGAEMERRLREEKLDVTVPGKRAHVGKPHPLSVAQRELEDIFIGMGFEIAEGPEVEYDYYNFQALNIPKDHPARDMQDTFYVTDNVLLRSQTSPVQVRTMEKKRPPIKIISPGRVYRSDPMDATHSPVFHQVEGLVVDKGVTMCNLKGVLEQFAHEIYGPDTKVRFRP